MQFLEQIRTNGMFVSVAALVALATFFLPLLSSMSGSYTIAGEAENGTLRTMLMQPIRRGTFLMAKWFVANAYVAIGMFIMGVAAIIAGGAVLRPASDHPALRPDGRGGSRAGTDRRLVRLRAWWA